MSDENNFISGGSLFMSSTTSSVFSLFSTNFEEDEINIACEKIKTFLKQEKKVDLPSIVQKLNIRTEIAIKAINLLRKQGYIKFEDEQNL